MIEFQNVCFKYHYEQYALFENLSFTLDKGRNTVLCDVLSGKTTLCKMLLGLLPPDSGNVIVDGKDVYFASKTFDPTDALWLPSEPTFFQNKSVLFNLQYPLRVRKQKNCEKKVFELAGQFGFGECLKEKVSKLSKQQKKQLAVARGLTVPRKIVLFDGFFDDTFQDANAEAEKLCALFHCETQVVFTTQPCLASGNTVVLDGKSCVFQGDCKRAQEVVSGLQWLAEKLKNR